MIPYPHLPSVDSTYTKPDPDVLVCMFILDISTLLFNYIHIDHINAPSNKIYNLRKINIQNAGCRFIL